MRMYVLCLQYILEDIYMYIVHVHVPPQTCLPIKDSGGKMTLLIKAIV